MRPAFARTAAPAKPRRMRICNNLGLSNLPTLLAGGGFCRGQLLGCDRVHNNPLPNLFVSMLQRMGLTADKFASSTGTMRGLDLV